MRAALLSIKCIASCPHNTIIAKTRPLSGMAISDTHQQCVTYRAPCAGNQQCMHADNHSVECMKGMNALCSFYSQNIYFNSDCHPYTGNINSETPGNSQNAFLQCGDVFGDTHLRIQLRIYCSSSSKGASSRHCRLDRVGRHDC